MEILYRMGSASAADVHAEIPASPSYSSVRSLLAILVERGLVSYTRQGRCYVFTPVRSSDRARRAATKQLLKTFYHDSPEELLKHLMDADEAYFSADKLRKIRSLLAFLVD
jgi:predicted transcriptional regulator